MMSEAFLAVEGAFALATRIRIGNEAAIPPIGATVIKKMMNDAIAKRCGDDFADDGIVDNKSDAAARFIETTDDAIAEVDDVFHSVELETMLVDGVLFAFSGGFVSIPKFMKEKLFETVIFHLETFRGQRGVVYYIREW